MIDPFIQFRSAGVDDAQSALALEEAQARSDAIRAAWDELCAYIQEVTAAIAEIARQFIVSVVEAFKPMAEAFQRRVLYARMSEHLPGWLVRPIVMYWPRRFLPGLRW